MMLDQIVATTRKLLEKRKIEKPLAQIERDLSQQSSPRDLAKALRGENVKLIAEIKRASPSKGIFCPKLDSGTLAEVYTRGGASAISVLTEPQYFRGSLTDLERVKAEVDLPILCKDFIVDPYQLYEARSCGADSVLIIAAVLSQEEMQELLDIIHSLDMEALVEVHNRKEVDRALALNPSVIGINNRNLTDFSVDLDTTLKLRSFIPGDKVVVSESGIHSRADVLKLESAGIDAVLVGEALVLSSDPAMKIKELLG